MSTVTLYVPETPAGTHCEWLRKKSRQAAWDALLSDTKKAGMPYRNRADLVERGYKVEAWDYPTELA